MRRPLALFLTAAMLLTACGGATRQSTLTTADPTTAPSPTASTAVTRSVAASPTAPAVTPTTLLDYVLSQPTPTPTPPPTRGPGVDSLREYDRYLRQLTEEGEFSGVVLLGFGGQVVFAKAYGLADRDRNLPNTITTRFAIASLTKQFTAMAVLILHDRGKLRLSDSVCKYVSSCPRSWRRVTLHHLLTHTSGLSDVTYRLEEDWGELIPLSKFIHNLRKLSEDLRPLGKYHYANSNYTLLAHVIERVSGVSYQTFITTQILEPLGLKETGFLDGRSLGRGWALGYSDEYTSDGGIHPSYLAAAGDMYSTAGDLYTWSKALDDDRLVPRQLLARMFAPHVRTSREWGPGTAYGYGWFVPVKGKDGLAFHPGGLEGFRSLLARLSTSREQVTMIVLSNLGWTNVFEVIDVWGDGTLSDQS